MLDKIYLDDTNRMVDMVAIARAAGSELSSYGYDYRGTCPIHRGDDPTSFSIHKLKDGSYNWKCFSECDDSGDGIQLVMRINGVSFKDAVKMIRGDAVFDRAKADRVSADLAEVRAIQAEKEAVAAREKSQALTASNLHLKYAHNKAAWVSEEWNKRGVTDNYRVLYSFGGCDEFTVGGVTCRTLTIPIFDYDYNVTNIRHRLLTNDVAGRYRPELAGVPAAPFLAHAYLGYDLGHTNIIVEGEIKAAVLNCTLHDPELQVIGVPGKGMFPKIIDLLRGKNNYVIPDPDAYEETLAFAKSIAAKIVKLPMKVDDYILANGISAATMLQIIRGGRLAK